MGRALIRLAAVLAMAIVAACAAPQRPGEARVPDDARVTHRAVFIGESYHDTEGTISLYRSRTYPVIVFESNFRFQGAQDAVVALGRDGYRADTALGDLLSNSGRQAYAVPDHIDIDRFNEVWLWNRTEDIPLGLARLTPI